MTTETSTRRPIDARTRCMWCGDALTTENQQDAGWCSQECRDLDMEEVEPDNN